MEGGKTLGRWVVGCGWWVVDGRYVVGGITHTMIGTFLLGELLADRRENLYKGVSGAGEGS